MDLTTAQPHDLLRLHDPADFLHSQPGPVLDWVPGALRRASWVVVRRAPAVPGWLPVGVRGPARHQRWATAVPIAAVAQRITPPELSHPAIWAATYPQGQPLAVQTLVRLAPALNQHGCTWGPAGSTAFELATGQSTLTLTSDLDLVLYAPAPLEAGDAVRLLASLEAVAFTPLDIQLQTPLGGVALLEFVRGGQVLVKMTTGPALRAAKSLWQ